ncbi:uncharacterized protein mRpL34 [Penaeus vannamei]|uniref:uncharacterized protein mRpL34 n=1 Tax=Penaeus vannamei TaxID=6689 RepID=UPI00387FAC05
MTSLLAVTRVPSVLGAVGGCLSACRTLFTRPQFPSSVALTPTPAPVFSVGGGAGSALLAPCLGLLGAVSGRTNVRNHFPRPSEVKRVKRHGWKARMATLSGRKVLMRRILKGRHVYSH